MKVIFILFVGIFLFVQQGVAKPTTQSMSEMPLLMPGKHSLYQRVLTRPNAELYSQPDQHLTASYTVDPFTIYYVYARKTFSGKNWVQVGLDKQRGADGWILAEQLIEWKQSLIVAFKDPVGFDRELLFRDRNSLKSLVDSQDLYGYRLLYEKAVTGKITDDSPVISIQPKAYVDILKNFYLVPIMHYEDVFLGSEQARLLEITTLPLEQNITLAKQQVKSDYRSGIVFVIDSTISMGPYIERTREVVRKVYKTIKDSGLQNKVSFGLIAYRDNPKVVPQLDYLTRTYVTLQEGTNPHTFLSKVKSVLPAKVSSKDFNEDAFAGIKQAIDDIDWRGFDARYVVLVTDAGARAGNDPLAQTGLDTDALRQLALDRGLSIWVLHLKTPEGRSNHAYAEAQYKKLSSYPGIGELYYPVRMGSVNEFGRVLNVFANEITRQVKEVSNKAPLNPTRNIRPTNDKDSLDAFKQKVTKLGHALRMRYLLKQEGGQVPSIFNAWMIDRDFTNPSRSSLEVRVLLTRDQLSDLQYVLKQILSTSEEGVFSPKGFLDELKSVAATISRDPAATSKNTRATGGGEKNLADMGYMREYIEDLPYKGEVMNLSLETWEEWPAKKQLAFINRLDSKIAYYQAIHDNTDLWISLDGGPIDGDSVFPIPLRMLP